MRKEGREKGGRPLDFTQKKIDRYVVSPAYLPLFIRVWMDLWMCAPNGDFPVFGRHSLRFAHEEAEEEEE